jgi:hypothetical protein
MKTAIAIWCFVLSVSALSGCVTPYSGPLAAGEWDGVWYRRLRETGPCNFNLPIKAKVKGADIHIGLDPKVSYRETYGLDIKGQIRASGEIDVQGTWH